jgi:hypothetical protein
VDHINNASADARPSVFVSATAVGYYGTILALLFLSLINNMEYKKATVGGKLFHRTQISFLRHLAALST